MRFADLWAAQFSQSWAHRGVLMAGQNSPISPTFPLLTVFLYNARQAIRSRALYLRDSYA